MGVVSVCFGIFSRLSMIVDAGCPCGVGCACVRVMGDFVFTGLCITCDAGKYFW